MEENLHRSTEERKSVEEEIKAAQEAAQEATKKIAAASAARAKAAALSKHRQSLLGKARRQEAAANQELEKVEKKRMIARQSKVNAEQLLLQAGHEATALGRTAMGARAAWNDAVYALDVSFNGVRDTVALVQADGKPQGDGHFELTAGKAKAAQKSLERFEKAWDVAKAAWTALETAEDAVLQFASARDGSEKELLKLEVAVEKAAY